MERFIFGIDIGGTAVKCGLFREDGQLEEKWEIPTNREAAGESVPREIADTVLKKCKERVICNSQEPSGCYNPSAGLLGAASAF